MSQCKNPHYLLYAIDGTGSRNWRPAPSGYSHVYQFYSRFNPVYKSKEFIDGPDMLGTEVSALIKNGMTWIKEQLKNLETKGLTNFRPAVNACAASLAPAHDVEIVLVGHSRGATVAGDMARKIGNELGIGVYFLGLFDAVDKSLGSDGGVVENVEVTSHALRNPSMPSERGPSRPSFGNTYLSSMSHYRQAMFNTSHGGVGGSPVTEYAKVAFLGDYSCAAPNKVELLTLELTQKASQGDSYAAHIVNMRNSPYAGDPVRGDMMMYLPSKPHPKELEMHAAEAKRLEEQKKRMEEFARRCETESNRVYKWMVNEAVSFGLPVS